MTKFGSALMLAVLCPAAGCDLFRGSEGTPVSRAWQRPAPVKPTPRPAAPAREPADATETRADAPRRRPEGTPERPAAGEAIAYVDGVPVSRARVVDFLMRSHGIGVLEQIVVIERAEREAAARGIQLTQADIDAEYDRWLRHLRNPELAGVAPADAPLDRAEGERLLERVLALRNISRAEYLAGVRRNAYLRRIVEHDVQFSEDQLAAEYRKAYGERVTARHIQLATLADAEQALRELAAPGAGFAEVARRLSANPDTAAAGGLMKDFSRDDEDLPAALRTVAFELEPGQPSNPVRIGEWFHIVQVEALHPPAEADFEQVRPELEARLRSRESEPAMQKLHQKLLDEAKVEVVDPVLAAEYEKKHPRQARAK